MTRDNLWETMLLQEMVFVLIWCLMSSDSVMASVGSVAEQTHYFHRDHIDVFLNRTERNRGFHRDLLTEVTIKKGRVHTDLPCTLVLQDQLPSGLYIDTYQLANRVKDGGPEVLTEEVIDTESPQFLSGQHRIFAYKELSQTDDDTLFVAVPMTVHIRYHRPEPESRQSEVRLEHPQVFLNCTSIELSDKVKKMPCSAKNNKICEWLQLEYISKEEELVFMVPVGEEDYVIVVVAVTVMAAAFACGFITYCIVHLQESPIKKFIRKKQRENLLQNEYQ